MNPLGDRARTLPLCHRRRRRAHDARPRPHDPSVAAFARDGSAVLQLA